MKTLSIVWIDDDCHVIDPVLWRLREDGYKITSFRSIVDADIETLKSCDLIILDIFLDRDEEKYGRYAGFEFLKAMRGELGIETPVMVFTVARQGLFTDNETLSKLGVVDYFLKPISSSELRDAVYAWVEVKNDTRT